MTRRGSEALQKEKQALSARSAARSAAKQGDRLSTICLREESVALMAQANQLLQADEVPPVGAGGEFLPIPEANGSTYSQAEKEVLLHPNTVTIGASAERLNLLEKADVSELGVDAAESMQAQNSLEKMLIHQMAACHKMAMELSQRSTEQHEPVEIARLANASARMMKTYQEGLLALYKMRTGGKQTVVVQHVNVTEGGQAVVTGSMGGRGAPDGGAK